MKKTILQCLSVFCAAVIGWLPLTAGTVSPYTENFDGLDTSKHDFAPLGWEHIVDSYSDWSDEYFVEYKNEKSGGQDGGAYLSAGSQSLGSYEGFEDVNDLLVTPSVSGDVSMYLKLGSLSGNVKMFSCTESDGSLVVGEELAVDGLDQLSTESWNLVTLPQRAAGTRIAIRLENACMDLFTAESAEIVLKPSLKIDKVTLVSESEPVADVDGKFKVAFDVMLTNNGQVDLKPGDENYSISIINSDKTAVFVTQDINVSLGIGESTATPVRVETEIDINQFGERDRYDIKENLGNTSVFGSWIEPIPYVGILEVLNASNQSIASGTIFDFGIVKDKPSTVSFNLRNYGGKDVTITEIVAPEGFTFSLNTPITVAVGERKTIDVILGTELSGPKSGKIVFVNDGTTTPEISVAGTVLSPDIFYEDFEDELSSGFIYADNWERTDYPNELAGSTGEYWMANSNATEPTMLITPKLIVEEGDSFSFRAAKRSAYGNYMNVYYSADRITWTKVKEITCDDEGTEHFSNEQPSYGSYNYCFSTFTVDNIPAGEWYIAFEAGYSLLDDIVGYKLATVDHDLYLVKESLPLKGKVNNTYEAEMSVKNIRLTSENAGSYVAKLYVNGEVVAETSPSEEWMSGEEKTFAFNYTPHEEGEVSVYMQVEIGEFLLKSSEVTVSILPETANMEVQVGEANGTDSNAPFAMNWKLSQTQTVYTQELLGLESGAAIESLGYNGYLSSDKDVTFHIKVWMANVAQTSMDVNSSLDTSSMTLVYEGDHKLEPQGSTNNLVRLLDLQFSTPFVYDGTNLCVVTESTSSEYKAVNFAKDMNVNNVSIYRRNDNELPAEWSAVSGMPVAILSTSREVPTISGKVTDGSTGEAVAATIELVSGDVLYKTETDAEGNYSMEVFQADKEYTMTVTAEGYDPVTETVTFTEGSVVKDIVFSNGARTVSGVVTDAETGAPIAYVQVMMQSGWTMFMGMTDNQGKYSFEVSEPDLVYTLSASYYGYQTYVEENVSVAEGNIVRNIALDKLTIGGVVTDAKTNEPLPGVRVMLSDGWWTEEEVTTDENGKYSFVIGDDTAEYTLTASLEGYNKYEKSGITFAEGSIVENIALEPIVPTVSGVVTDAATNEPIEGVQVMMQSGGVIFFGMTDAEGHYSFEVTETGLAYTLTAYVAGYKTYTEENVSVADGDIVRDIALEKLTISGVITDSKTNEPLAGVRVVLSDDWFSEWEMTTDENGAYSFEIADDSMEYALSASLEGYNSYEKTGIIFDEGSVVLDIALEQISGVGMVTVDGLYVKGVNNAIEVVAPGKAIVSVYDLGGRLIRSVEVNEGKTLIEGLVEGIYLVNRVKVVVK